MAITNKFIHFNTKAGFVSQYASAADDFKNKYTIFIKDTKQIWAHGGMYGGAYRFSDGTDGSFTVSWPSFEPNSSSAETLKVSIGKPATAGKADSATTATTAATANKLAHTFTVGGSVFDGSANVVHNLSSTEMSTAWSNNEVSGKTLNLNGTFNIKDGLGTYVTASSSGVNSLNGFYETSDIRKKNLVGDIEVDLDDLQKIPKKYFTWKDDANKEQQIGTVAQTVMKYFPELVTKGEDGYYSVDYAKLSIVALAAIDKLYDMVKALQ